MLRLMNVSNEHTHKHNNLYMAGLNNSGALSLLASIWLNRRMILFLAGRELITRYAGTALGALWAVIQPLATVLVFWLVFSVGLRLHSDGDIPFLIYFICALLPWMTFSEVLTISTQGVRNNTQLIKKTLFPIEIMPVVYLLAASIVHLFILIICILLILGHDLSPGPLILTLPVYYVAMGLLILGLGWIVSAINVVAPDTAHGVTVVLNLWFWLTPIVWSRTMLPDNLQWLVDLNPMSFIVDGYRNALIYQQWPDTISVISYIAIAGVIFLIGAMVFHRLKVEFAESL